MSMYTARIAALLEPADKIDPRHVEGYMRVGSFTLDHLSPDEFAREVRLGKRCVQQVGRKMAERIARSVGL